jgi:hypothetical protein
MLLRRFDAPAPTRGPLVVTESLSACDLANTLMLKLCGFIEDQQAQLLDVSEDRYRLQIGYNRLTRFWHGIAGHDPVEVTLQIHRDESYHPEAGRANRPGRATIDVAVRPMGGSWRRDRFEECGQRIVQRLRLHLMAN